MSPSRLQQVCEFLFPGEKWRAALAQYLKVNITTIRRWEQKGETPWVIQLLLEHCFDYGLVKLEKKRRE